MKNYFAFLLILATFSLSACNTVRGVGQDVGAAGKTVGHGVKEGGKAVGHAFGDAAKGIKEGVTE